MTNLERFLSKVNKTESCWIWTGFKDKGYGRMGWKTPKGYRSIPASRISYMLFRGEIPEGMFVCHKCDNPPCVNPDHLFLGSSKENTHDMVKKGRCKAGWQNAIKTHCIRGHLLSGENLRNTKDGLRRCKVCHAMAVKRCRDRKKL